MDTMERCHREKSSTYVPGVCKTVQRSSHIEQLSKTNYFFTYKNYNTVCYETIIEIFLLTNW